jgi:HAE1 family hydrophobic/amphiphilic exporter-1
MPANVAQERFIQTFEGLGAGPQYALIASGRVKTQNQSNAAFVMAFAFSLIFMYMILAAQFESFVHPIAILTSVPVTIPFALLSLILLGQSMTIYSILGIFLLFGIVKKNGILQVDYTNVLRQRGKENANEVPEAFQANGQHGGNGDPPKLSAWNRWIQRMSEEKRIRLWAILEANRTRLRPILMTTLMLIAGMVPIAMGEGPGAANRASMAKVIVGGQALSLLLSLLITPVAYSLLDDLALWRRSWGKKKRQEESVEAVELERPLAAGEELATSK